MKFCKPDGKPFKLGIIALGSPLAPERCEQALAVLGQLGVDTEMPLDPGKFYGKYDHQFSNGSVEDRLNAMKVLLEDQSVDCILSARGGYGAAELLPGIAAVVSESTAKPLIGISDATALLASWPALTGSNGLHGFSLSSTFAEYGISEDATESVTRLRKYLCGKKKLLSDLHSVFPEAALGKAEVSGRILAGNLSVLCSLLATPYDVKYEGSILALEEVGEAPYRIHRLLLQLLYAGKLESLRGLIFGRLARCASSNGPSAEEVVRSFCEEYLMDKPYPIACSESFGHWGVNSVLPVGEQAVWTGSSLGVQ